MNPSKTQNTIEVENIEVVYKLEEKKIHAVKDASFNVTERKMLGIIGEDKGSIDDDLVKDVPFIEEVSETLEVVVDVASSMISIPGIAESGLINDDGYEYITREDGPTYYRVANSQNEWKIFEKS